MYYFHIVDIGQLVDYVSKNIQVDKEVVVTSIDYSGKNKPDSSRGGVGGVIIPPIQWDNMAQAQGALRRLWLGWCGCSVITPRSEHKKIHFKLSSTFLCK
jgi:hypothetical protein